MDLPGGDMCIVNTFQPKLLQDLFYVGHVVGQVCGEYRGILDPGNPFPVSRNIRQQTQSGRSQGPDPLDLISTGDQWEMITQSGLAQIFFKCSRCVGQFFFGTKGKFNHQHGTRIALHKKAVLVLLNVCLGTLHDGVVHELDGGRLMVQGQQVSLQRLLQGLEMGTDQPFVLWGQRNDIQLDPV